MSGKIDEVDKLTRLKRRDLEASSLKELEDIYQSLREVLSKYQTEQVLPATLEEAFDRSLGKSLKKEPRKREEMIKVYGVEYILLRLQSLPQLREQHLSQQKSLEERQAVLKVEKTGQEEQQKFLELVEQEKNRLLEGWNNRKIKIYPYNPDDLKELLKREAVIRERDRYLTPQEREFQKELAKYESLFGVVLSEAKVFGEQSLVYPTDRYDDRITGVDIVAKIKPNSPPLFIDLTHNFEETPDKLLDHINSPIKKLGYPVDKLLDGSPGIPVVAGIGFEELKNLVDAYLEDKLAGGQLGRMLEEFDLTLAEIFIPQVKEQKQRIAAASSGLKPGDVTADEADKIYELTLDDLENIKGLHPDVHIDERSPWYQKLSHPLETIRQKYPDH